MKYQVLDNDVPAMYPMHKVHPSWNQSTFDSALEAFQYAIKWLGVYAPDTLTINVPYDYSGYGDCLTIIEV